MKWIADIKNPQPLYFIIEHDERAGFYLYFHYGDFCFMDYLQDTLDQAKKFALEKFGVSQEAWQSIENQPPRWRAAGKGQAALTFSIENHKSQYHLCIYQGDQKLYDNPKKMLDAAQELACAGLMIPKDAWKQVFT